MFFNKDNSYEELNDEIKNLKRELDNLKNDQKQLKDELDSHYDFFNTIFIDYNLESKGILKSMQTLCQEVLDFTANVCEKYNLDYWITAGTLLGAFRHGTYIPWDDDIDLSMMRKDFDQFNRVALKEIENNGLSDCLVLKVYPMTKKDFILPFTKLDCITPDDLFLGGIDLNAFDFADDKNITKDEFIGFRNEFFKLLCKNDYESAMEIYYSKFNLSYDDGRYLIKNPTYIRYALRYKKDVAFWDKDRVFPLKKIEFNGKEYNCPKDVEYYLKPEYDEFMKIPRVLKEQHNNVEKLRDVENIDEQYDFFINKIRQANENFK